MPNIIISHDFIDHNIEYGFLTKNLDGSTHKYLKKENDDINVQEIINNKKISCTYISKNLDPSNLSILRQQHTNIAVKIDKAMEINNEIIADGQVTNKKNIALAVLTADCVPILFADSKNKVIGACHSGWKGARNGVIENTIFEMINLQADISNITAIIGPCIQQHSYEVGPEFYENFIEESINNKSYFINSKKPGYYLFDLPKYVINKLKKANIPNIINLDLDTLSNEDKFFSFRRSTLQNINHTGNIISIIMLK